ncbi:MAG: ABC transporter ATP-binding protein [Endomicrobiaceae bacterium]|nr:ABC transporter ATP-binding protein [Endomicrobiaceae bacterium]
MTNIINVKNLSVHFGKFKAVDNISFDVKKGEIFGFLGANGAGKTTTIRVLCGILKPASGNVILDGKDVTKSTGILKKEIGYMSQKSTLYKDLTIEENINFSGSLYNMPAVEIKKRRQELFDFIGLKENPLKIVQSVPLGIKQMVALCATVLHQPKIIFLDEPTAGVDPKTREKFWELIKQLSAQGKTIFVTTHYMDEAIYCNRIVLMDKGHIVDFDSPENLKNKYFSQKPLEIKFKDKSIQNKILAEIESLKIGYGYIFGETLRLFINNKTTFENWILKYKNILTYDETEAGLEDVFLKALQTEHNK